MRILVTGGRDYADRAFVFATLDRIHAERGISMVIHGGATGADALADQWALAHGVQVQRFDADWRTHGRNAGPIRNRRMLAEGKPDGVVAFPGGRGTTGMVRAAHEAGVRVWDLRTVSQFPKPQSPKSTPQATLGFGNWNR